MRTPSREQRGFTLVELLVVIAIIAILASILFPVLSRAQQKARESACLANVRQLAVAMTMYAQDNKYFPSAETWGANLLPYTQNSKAVFHCPADKDHGVGYSDYILSNAVVDAAGNGIKNENMISASNVPVLYDGTAATIANALTLGIDATASLQDRHGVNVAYADGHVASFGGRDLSAAKSNPEDLTNTLNQGMYAANAFGWVKNPGLGGVPPSSSEAAAGSWTYGGSSTMEPLWEAVNATWTAALAPAKATTGIGSFYGIDGSGHWKDAGNDLGGASSLQKNGATAANSIVGVTPATGTAYIVAMDAVAPVVASATKLTTSYSRTQLYNIFVNGDTSATGANSATLNLYIRRGDSGTYGFFAKCIDNHTSATFTWGSGVTNSSGKIRDFEFLLGGREALVSTIPTGVTATYVNSTREMLEAVAKDPYGIGFASAGEADPDNVTTCDLQISTTVTQHFTRAAVENVTKTSPVAMTDATGWIMTRALCAIQNTTNPAATGVMKYLAGSFQKSNIFKSEFFTPTAIVGWADGNNTT